MDSFDRDLDFLTPGVFTAEMDRLFSGRPADVQVPDPFCALAEAHEAGISFAQWQELERVRRANKTLTNRLGDFHQAIIGALPGWRSTGRHGDAYDVIHETPFGTRQRPAVAEVKAKYNTLNSSGKKKLFESFCGLKAHAQFKGYDFYLIEIIQKKPLHAPWTPSSKVYSPIDDIRVIGAPEVFTLSTNDPTAFPRFLAAFERYVVKRFDSTPDPHFQSLLQTVFPSVSFDGSGQAEASQNTQTTQPANEPPEQAQLRLLDLD